jgi:hypothetical protein
LKILNKMKKFSCFTVLVWGGHEEPGGVWDFLLAEPGGEWGAKDQLRE